MPTDLELAEQHCPRLVLYPEISSPERKKRKGWREDHLAPLYEDYHPRSVKLILDNSDRRSDDNGLTIFPGIHNTDRNGFWRRYAEIEKENYPHTTYAWIVRKDDLTAIEYWLAYPYNDWRSTHEGDWEVVMVFLRDGAPIACAYSAHHGGFRLPWELVETDGTHPIAYVAHGSHANYFFGPKEYSNKAEAFGLTITTGEFPFSGDFVDFTTSTSEEGKLVTPAVKLIPSNKSDWVDKWEWLNISGRWGKTEVPRWLRWLPKKIRFYLSRRVWAAPRAINDPDRKKWGDPFTWADDVCVAPQFLGSWLARFR
jgi:hypothetical protein